MLLLCGGSQRLPSNISGVRKIADQTDLLKDIELELNKYVTSIDNFTKQLHNKDASQQIYKRGIDIINHYDFDIKESFKLLWEMAILGKLVITQVPNNETLDDVLKKHIEIIKSKMHNNIIIRSITNEIKTPSKYKNIIKRIFNIGCEFESIFEIKGLTESEKIKFDQIDNSDKKICESLDAILHHQDFKDNEDDIVSTFYNYIKNINSNKIRNKYYNQILIKLVDTIKNSERILKRIPTSLTNMFIQFYCYLIEIETVKTVNPIITNYIASHPIEWFSYQVMNMATKLPPHWNFKSDEFVLDSIQIDCLQSIDLKQNLLLSAPTSWGKTLLSTYAIYNNKKIWYIVPSEALALQVAGILIGTLMEKEKLNGFIKKNVRLEIDSMSTKRFNQEDDIIVATPKSMYRLIINNDVNHKQDYIILDEFHNIVNTNDDVESNESVYYEYILKFGGFHKIPVMCLSATIPNFSSVYDWLSTILYGHIFAVNEVKRFFNQKRMLIHNKKFISINPLHHMKKETLRLPNFTSIGLYPQEVLELYKKVPNVENIDEKTHRFIKLDDIHKLECNIIKYLKNSDDNVLDNIISDTPLESDSLTPYELYNIIRKTNTNMKPMLIFKMDPIKCLDVFTTLICMIRDYNELVYGNYNDDQPIIDQFFKKYELESTKINVKSSKKTKDDSNDTKDDSAPKDAEELKSELKEKLFNSECLPFLIDFYEKYTEFRKNDDGEYQVKPIIDEFNNKYGANLSAQEIIKLRKKHVENEKCRMTFNMIGLRPDNYVHDNCKLTNFSISTEEKRKIRYQINRELARETSINGSFNKMKNLGKKYNMYDTDGDNISYTHPVMLGIDYGILCYNSLMNPALQRICQQLISKKTFITIASKELAVGINYPIKTVLLLGGFKGEPIEEIENTLAHQASGRAGRRGLDTEGIVIYSGVHITQILVPQYKNIIPNNISHMMELLTNNSEDFKTFVMTGVRPIEKVIEKPVIAKPIIVKPVENIKVEIVDILKNIEENFESWEDMC